MTLCRIEPTAPMQNANIERFNRTWCHKVLDAYRFRGIEQAQPVAEEWRLDDNEPPPGRPGRTASAAVHAQARDRRRLRLCNVHSPGEIEGA